MKSQNVKKDEKWSSATQWGARNDFSWGDGVATTVATGNSNMIMATVNGSANYFWEEASKSAPVPTIAAAKTQSDTLITNKVCVITILHWHSFYNHDYGWMSPWMERKSTVPSCEMYIAFATLNIQITRTIPYNSDQHRSCSSQHPLQPLTVARIQKLSRRPNQRLWPKTIRAAMCRMRSRPLRMQALRIKNSKRQHRKKPPLLNRKTTMMTFPIGAPRRCRPNMAMSLTVDKHFLDFSHSFAIKNE